MNVITLLRSRFARVKALLSTEHTGTVLRHFYLFKKKTPFCVPVKAENRLVGDDGIMMVAVCVTGAYTTHKLYFCTNSRRRTKQ